MKTSHPKAYSISEALKMALSISHLKIALVLKLTHFGHISTPEKQFVRIVGNCVM